MIATPGRDLAAIDDAFLVSPLVDGWRCLAVIDDRVRLRSRAGHDLGREAVEVAAALGRVRVRGGKARPGYTVLDGVLRSAARGSEPARIASAERFVAIDALCLDGRDLTALDVARRLGALELLDLDAAGDRIEAVFATRGPGARYLEQFVATGAPGLLARRAASRYRPGVRSRDWLEFREAPVAEFALCGIASSGALVLGMPTPTGLAFAGVTWPTRTWADLALRCVPGPPPFPPPRVWGSLGEIAWSIPSLWVAVTPDVRDGSGKGGPRWRLVRVQEDLSSSGAGAVAAQDPGAREIGDRA